MGIGAFQIGVDGIGDATPGPVDSGREPDGRFGPGNRANPSGRPPGSRNRVLVALDAIGEAGAEAVLRRTVEAAQGGDMRAAEVILSRLWPARKGRPVALPDMPRVESAAGLVQAMAAVADAVAAGTLTPDEGAAVGAVLDMQRRAVETADLAARVEALEAKDAGR